MLNCGQMGGLATLFPLEIPLIMYSKNSSKIHMLISVTSVFGVDMIFRYPLDKHRQKNREIDTPIFVYSQRDFFLHFKMVTFQISVIDNEGGKKVPVFHYFGVRRGGPGQYRGGCPAARSGLQRRSRNANAAVSQSHGRPEYKDMAAKE